MHEISRTSATHRKKNKMSFYWLVKFTLWQQLKLLPVNFNAYPPPANARRTPATIPTVPPIESPSSEEVSSALVAEGVFVPLPSSEGARVPELGAVARHEMTRNEQAFKNFDQGGSQKRRADRYVSYCTDQTNSTWLLGAYLRSTLFQLAVGFVRVPGA